MKMLSCAPAHGPLTCAPLLQAVLALLRRKPAGGEAEAEDPWPGCRAAVGRPGFFASLGAVGAEGKAVPRKRCRRARRFLQGVTEDGAKQASVVALVLHRWVCITLDTQTQRARRPLDPNSLGLSVHSGAQYTRYLSRLYPKTEVPRARHAR